jgi:N-terminal region of glycosyl transferase group 7/N-terminal domain of galactosyltransferase
MDSCIIVPYRDREEHLKKFVAHYSRVLPDVEVFVIEQTKENPFNRAKLFNVGFDILRQNYGNFIFHDVDQLIDIKRSDPITAYASTDNVVHLGTKLEQFGYKLPDKEFFGGITIFSKSAMEKINGWSNLIWGWGSEAEMVRDDLIKKSVPIEVRETYYKSLPHSKAYISHELIKAGCAIREKGKNDEVDGLSNLTYTIVRIEPRGRYTLIKVEI